MVKQLLLSSLLLISYSATASINLDFTITITNEAGTRTITCNQVLQDNAINTLETEDIIVDVTAQQNGETVVICANIYDKTEENGVVLLSNPVIEAVLNETATITLGDENNNTLTFTVTPSLADTE